MTDDTDLTEAIKPKSDQLNADDFLTGPRTIRITRVRVVSGEDQPVSIFFAGDDGKPFKPCKSMGRVLAYIWGPDGKEYVGRSLTLYRDPKVKWGGIEVGGIRISHMSHIDRDMVVPLTQARGVRIQYHVRAIRENGPSAAPTLPAGDLASVLKQIADAPPELLPKVRERLNDYQWTKDDKAQIRKALEGKQ